MDVFSLGCVIAELWRDGTPTFTLSQLFKYQEGQFDIEGALADIADAHIRDMVRSMLSLEPSHRSTFSQYLEKSSLECFPLSFSTFLHPYLVELQRFTPSKTSPSRGGADVHSHVSGAAMRGIGQWPQSAAASSQAEQERTTNAASEENLNIQHQADHRIERLYEEWSVLSTYLDAPHRPCGADRENVPKQGAGLGSPFSEYLMETEEEHGILGTSEAADLTLPVQLAIPGLSSADLQAHRRTIAEDGPALIVLSTLLANLRNALRPVSKLHAFDLLLHMSARWLSDEAKLDRVLPYVVALFDDPSSKVRAAAVRSTAQLLLLVNTITPANENVCSEYVFPNLRRMLTDASAVVRATYAACFPQMLASAEQFIQQYQAMQASGALKADHDVYEDFLEPGADEASYDTQMHELRAFAQEQVTVMLMDPSASVKRSLLANMGPICRLFSPSDTNDVLLSHMITYLNDRDWMLRDAFFEAIVDVAFVGGPSSVEEYIVPLMVQALSDSEEFVSVRVLQGLQRLVKASLLARPRIYELLSATSGFLCHPNLWIRQGAAIFLEAAVRSLDPTDRWTIAYPSIRPLCKTELQCMSAVELLETAKPPLTRNLLQAALRWASAAKETSFWKPRSAKDNGKAGLADGMGNWGLALITKIGRGVDAHWNTPKTDEDDKFIDKLRAQGLGPQDEVKLVALREYVWKLSRSTSGQRLDRPPGASLDSPSGSMSPAPIHAMVQSIPGVTPQTIFFTYNDRRSSATEDQSATIPRGSIRSVTDISFQSQLARRRIGGRRNVNASSIDEYSAAQDLRRRMTWTSSTWGTLTTPGAERAGKPGIRHLSPTSGDSPEPVISPLASSRSVSSSDQGKLGIPKAVPAVSESSANAMGTMGDKATRLGSLKVGDVTPSGEPGLSRNETVTSGGRDGKAEVREGPEAPLFWSTYDDSDPYIQAHLETVFVRNFRDRDAQLGPRVGQSASRKRQPRAVLKSGPAGARKSSKAPTTSTSSPQRLAARQIAYFNEHAAAVTAIAVSTDHAFFASASDDGTIKIWDTARLEKNVTSQSRVTYSAHACKVTALLALDNTHCLVSTATDGGLHVWRVEMTSSSLPRYGKPRLVSNFQLSTPGEYVTALLQSSSQAGSSRLILGTSQSRITILDLRTMQVLQSFRNPAHHGPISCMCSDKDRIWLLCGTLRGNLLLWDLRFGLMIKSWRVGTSELDTDAVDDVKITCCAQHPSKGKGRWVVISYERALRAEGQSAQDASSHVLLETWDIDRGVVVEFYEWGLESGLGKGDHGKADATGRPSSRPQEPSTSAKAVQQKQNDLLSPAAAIERLVRAKSKADLATQPVNALANGAIADNVESGMPNNLDGMGEGSIGVLGWHVKTFLVGNDVFPSGVLGSDAAEQDAMFGGWLDAGKLAEDAADGNAGPSSAASHAAPTGRSGTGRGSAGYIISGGHDCRLRFWDLGRADRSLCFGSIDDKPSGRSDFRTVQPKRSGNVAGRNKDGSDENRHPTPDSSNVTRYVHLRPPIADGAYQRRSHGTGSTLRSPLLSQQQSQQAQAHMRAHRDTVTALAVIEWPFRAVVAGDRTGSIKVWD